MPSKITNDVGPRRSMKVTFIFENHFFLDTFSVLIPFLSKRYMIAKIMETQVFHEKRYDPKFMLWRGFMIYLTYRFSDFITILTYVLLDNFCLCLF